MALDGNEKASSPSSDEPTFGKEGYYDGFSPISEKGGRTTRGPNGRKMSRIDRPITTSIGGLEAGLTSDDATDPSITVGKQLELEADNAIKYRTCSWQKV